ncbi:MAG: hypothetical protein A2806_02970 [Candidatus Terrybacteria bacterium RIFCSPHIGHO2_01_FULL_48_17]|uniref:Uncharacterized protein n=1 Tax=Candidatus Terrybacteria bacterium RIFCSPHIGHO2_01_FULL_48_17 TaxID=1802362 RepID=A0A1G2PL75_9BACT|nr:MAG: hypothetical protein A2806_02970 [Candidatus Terrybacteria bacterium RIFCSPHIGHO2_01_FULL_48_17]OHA53063.1 MAG: hypothetical protein A3A30_02665 [Candidatus Terrybacteria bacterium RIFCSPLOWO2_01_FULL_48_14]
MFYLKITGFRTGSRDGRFEFSLRDELDHWGPPQQVEPQIGIDSPVEMSDSRAVRRALRCLTEAQKQGREILRETAAAPLLSRIDILGLSWVRQQIWQRPR